ncbi:dihydrofolate reductase family protein [Micromonospora sp. IBHARD004]|uniref:dihydrofolate reductase family protein n=1 Tax=Micromonospora sp. IBHARD004 TaxID=3457764 RepID=UPI0040591377
MTQVVVNMTMSLDGFTAGRNVGVTSPLGEGAEHLHDWITNTGGSDGPNADGQAVQEMFTTTGAFVMGRRTFDVGIDLWGDDGAFGVPCFVVTQRAKGTLTKGPTTFTFVTDGVDQAVKEARTVAAGKNVCVMGGADIAQQCLRAGLVDQLRIHLAPILIGAGSRLFDHPELTRLDLERTGVVNGPIATHLAFRLVRPKDR